MVAIRVHASQTDRQGEPYLLHVLRVVEAVSDEAKVVAALHDVIEDGYGLEHQEEAREEIGRACGLSINEDTQLGLLTRVPDQTYSGYINIIAGCSPRALAREVKLADLRDNLGRIPERPMTNAHSTELDWDNQWASLKARYEKAIATLEAMC